MYIFCDTLYCYCEWLSQTGKADLPKNNKKTQFFNYLVILGKGCPFLVQYVLYHAWFFYFSLLLIFKKFSFLDYLLWFVQLENQKLYILYH